jgi:hypothetical protein
MAKKNFKGGLDSLIENSLGIKKSRKGEMKGNPVDLIKPEQTDDNDEVLAKPRTPQKPVQVAAPNNTAAATTPAASQPATTTPNATNNNKASENNTAANNKATDNNAAANQAAANQPTVSQVVDNNQAVNQAANNQPVVNQPIDDKPADNQAVANTQTVNQPVANPQPDNQPVANPQPVNQPIVNKPADNQAAAPQAAANTQKDDTTKAIDANEALSFEDTPDDIDDNDDDVVVTPSAPKQVVTMSLDATDDDDAKIAYLKEVIADLRHELFLWRNGTINVQTFNATLHTHGLKYNPDNNEIEEFDAI